MEAEVLEVASACLPMSQRHPFKTPIPINAKLMSSNRQSVLKTVPDLHQWIDDGHSPG